MKKYTVHRYSRVHRTGKNAITIRVATYGYLKFLWYRVRGHFAQRRGDSFEYNEIDKFN